MKSLKQVILQCPQTGKTFEKNVPVWWDVGGNTFCPCCNQWIYCPIVEGETMTEEDGVIFLDYSCPKCHGNVGHLPNCPDGAVRRKPCIQRSLRSQ